MGWITETLEIGFGFTGSPEGSRVAGLHEDADNIPRVVVHRIPNPALAVLYAGLLRTSSKIPVGVGFQTLLSLAFMLAAWIFPASS